MVPNPSPPELRIDTGKVRAALAPKNNVALILGVIGGGLATGGTGAIIGALAGFAVDSYYAHRFKKLFLFRRRKF